MLVISKKNRIFANEFARTGCTLAIQTSLMALGLRRPCIVILKRVTRKGALSCA